MPTSALLGTGYVVQQWSTQWLQTCVVGAGVVAITCWVADRSPEPDPGSSCGPRNDPSAGESVAAAQMPDEHQPTEQQPSKQQGGLVSSNMYSSGAQVGGHSGGILFEGDRLLKRFQGEGKIKGEGSDRGGREARFLLEVAPRHTFLSRFVPRAFGKRTMADGSTWLEMENLSAGCRTPAVMDLKVGTWTCGPDACLAKIHGRIAKDAKSTTLSHGLCVVGARYPWSLDTPVPELIEAGEKLGAPCTDEQALRKCLSGFFCTRSLARQALAFVPSVPSICES